MRLIIIEGCKGSGKTTLINQLKIHCENNDKVIFESFPSGSSKGDEARSLLMDDNINQYRVDELLTDDFLDFCNDLQKGYTYILDRTPITTTFFLRGVLPEHGLEYMFSEYIRHLAELVVCHAPLEQIKRRRKSRKKEWYDTNDEDYSDVELYDNAIMSRVCNDYRKHGPEGSIVTLINRLGL